MTTELLLVEIRKLIDTTTLPADLFSELCRSAIFYAIRHPLNIAAKLAVEECC
jgi:hypothetical protein